MALDGNTPGTDATQGVNATIDRIMALVEREPFEIGLFTPEQSARIREHRGYAKARELLIRQKGWHN